MASPACPAGWYFPTIWGPGWRVGRRTDELPSLVVCTLISRATIVIVSCIQQVVDRDTEIDTVLCTHIHARRTPDAFPAHYSCHEAR